MESHPANQMADLRLDRPFPGLVRYMDAMDLDSMDKQERRHKLFMHNFVLLTLVLLVVITYFNGSLLTLWGFPSFAIFCRAFLTWSTVRWAVTAATVHPNW